MPDFRDFLDQIKEAGVLVQGEDILIAETANTTDWATVVASLAAHGRQRGVQFHRQVASAPSGSRLHEILRGYPFTFDQARIFIQNVLYRGAPETDPDRERASESGVGPEMLVKFDEALDRLRRATFDNDIDAINLGMHAYACRLVEQHGAVDAGRILARGAASALSTVDPALARTILLRPFGRDSDTQGGSSD